MCSDVLPLPKMGKKLTAICVSVAFGFLMVILLCRACTKPIEHWSVTGLIQALRKGDSTLDHGAQAVWRVLPSRIQQLLHSLEPKRYEDYRLRACWELAERGPSASNAVSALMRVVEHDQDFWVVNEAIVALGAIGPPAQPALPQLLNLLTNQSKVWLSHRAAWALVGIDPKNSMVASFLVNALAVPWARSTYENISPADFEDPISAAGHYERWVLIRALERVQPQTPETMAVLYRELEHGEYGSQATAAVVLGGLHPVTSETVTKLIEALRRSGDERLPADPVPAWMSPPWISPSCWTKGHAK